MPFPPDRSRSAAEGWPHLGDCIHRRKPKFRPGRSRGRSWLIRSSPLSLTQGIVIAGNSSGLPTLPTADLAIYSRRTPSHLMVPRLTTFLVESVAAWEADYRS